MLLCIAPYLADRLSGTYKTGKDLSQPTFAEKLHNWPIFSLENPYIRQEFLLLFLPHIDGFDTYVQGKFDS